MSTEDHSQRPHYAPLIITTIEGRHREGDPVMSQDRFEELRDRLVAKGLTRPKAPSAAS